LNTAREGMMKQIQILKKEPVEAEELQNAKDQLIGNYTLALETNLDKAGALANYEASGRGFDFIEKYSELIQSVTAQDILNVANKYFKNNYVESIVDKAK
jgi:predicted Zn-dependent peptidase